MHYWVLVVDEVVIGSGNWRIVRQQNVGSELSVTRAIQSTLAVFAKGQNPRNVIPMPVQRHLDRRVFIVIVKIGNSLGEIRPQTLIGVCVFEELPVTLLRIFLQQW